MLDPQAHRKRVYATKAPDAVSWYRPHAEQSLALIASTGIAKHDPIIDVGGGASTLVDDLAVAGYGAITVLDLSVRALQAAQERLRERAAGVRWITGDIHPCVAGASLRRSARSSASSMATAGWPPRRPGLHPFDGRLRRALHQQARCQPMIV